MNNQPILEKWMWKTVANTKKCQVYSKTEFLFLCRQFIHKNHQNEEGCEELLYLRDTLLAIK
jgi:hypothetical protein